MRMYPKFKMGAIVVGVLVPVVVTVIFALTETEKVVMLSGVAHMACRDNCRPDCRRVHQGQYQTPGFA